MSEFTSTNPYTNETIARYPGFVIEDLDRTLASVQVTQTEWQGSSCAVRAQYLKAISRVLLENCETLATTATLEMGKPISASRAEVKKCATVCDYYAENGARHLADQPVETASQKSYIAYRPLGIILAIMPWNFPYWQVFRFLAPTLMAGNAAVLKHASNVPGCSLAIENIIRQAGLPENIFRALLMNSADTKQVIAHPLVKAVSFTGSTAAGKAIASEAGLHIKKTVLELGGSDPYLILQDAELESAVATCVASRLVNNGQSCIAAKRFIVHASLYDSFIQKMVALMASKTSGDPLQENTDIGPLARPDISDKLRQQVAASLAAGAKLALGGTMAGTLYPPTILVDVAPGMPAFDEELFGPVAAVIRADSDEHAIALANRTQFGLGAAVFTRNVARGEQIARDELEAGCCFVNALVASDPRLPFGGIKNSGYGRELGPAGIREFTNIKTVVVS